MQQNLTEGPITKKLIIFALPLMVGIVCGAYSSVCIAGVLWYTLRCKFEVKESDE